jgi:hypothetical protein
MLQNILKRSDELKLKVEQSNYRYFKEGWTPAIQIEVDSLEKETNELKKDLDKYIKDNNITLKDRA